MSLFDFAHETPAFVRKQPRYGAAGHESRGKQIKSRVDTA
jgi:hypothetical protein